jgi:ABC-2 type transport system ATP-binding protein
MKVGEQALYLAQLKNVPKREAQDRLKKWFKKFDIDTWWDKKVEELSKGMQQKIQFITTILHRPKLLIFDEPFSGFDPINANILKEEILNLREEGATVIFSTHNMESVEVLCDHIALINRSNKILDGKVKEIKQEYSTNTFTTRLTNLKGSLRVELHSDFKVEQMEEKDNFLTAKITITNNANPNDLVKNLMQIGEVHAFNEVIPSMNEIFIRKVQENN